MEVRGLQLWLILVFCPRLIQLLLIKLYLDLIYNSYDEGKTQLIERIEKLYGPHIIECSVALGTGKSEYELIHVK